MKRDNHIFNLKVGELASNCYLVQFSQTNKSCFLVDPGDDAGYIIDKILKESLEPKAIFLTHGHYDHVLASAELQLIFKIPIFLNYHDLVLYQKAVKTAKFYSKLKDVFVSKSVFDLTRQSKKEIEEKFGLRIIDTPGHTPGSVSFYMPAEETLFVGDLVFADGSVGNYLHKYSDKQCLFQSIEKILALPPKTKVYPGHGDVGSVERLKYLLNIK